MLKMIRHFSTILLCLILLAACGTSIIHGELKKVGLLVPETINDQVWGTKGYKGMLKIQSRFDVDVYYKEGINSKLIIERAVKEFDQKGINLIFGHGSEYSTSFNELADQYPHIHFVSFNGDAEKKNTTSLNFEGYAMGFFGGMVASHMSESGQIGLIAAYDWQPEVKGFYEGALLENKNAKVHIHYSGSWDDVETSIVYLDELLNQQVDVIYPAGDGFNVPIIEKIKEHGLYAIGFISDQADLGESTVLTSTVQHVDVLYELVAERFNSGNLDEGNLYFDFQDDVISLGKFSPQVDQEFVKYIDELIVQYKETGNLPNK